MLSQCFEVPYTNITITEKQATYDINVKQIQGKLGMLDSSALRYKCNEFISNARLD